MDFAAINWLAVLACVIVSMVLGSIWYHPKVFYTIWWKAIGKSEKDRPAMSNMTTIWILTVLCAVVEAIAMAFLVNSIGGQMTGGVTAAAGAMVGFMLWLGIVAPTSLVNKIFGGFSLTAWAIEVGNHLATLLLFGLILGAWH
jgi:hypothetical protein